MVQKYSAFISYRHTSLDTKVAKHVQRGLEHMHIPRAVRKTTGKNSIGKVFRDEDELPIDVSIDESIKMALDNATFLIVICSPRTEESRWVQREIEYFLTNHDKSHVLVVLAEGKSSEVIPELLKQEAEPLCCDYRQGLRNAKAKELPRIAAAILGCAYDELIQRQKQYRMRQLMYTSIGISVIAISFMVYFFWSDQQIRHQYETAMRTRSRYLTTESERLLGDGNRVLALQLALKAMPKKKSDYRLFPELYRVFASATYAYVTPDWSLAMSETGKYYTDGVIEYMIVSNNGRYVAVVDRELILTVFDIEDEIRILSKRLQTDSISGQYLRANEDIRLCLFGEDCFLVVFDDQRTLACYRFFDGKEAWKKHYDERIGFAEIIYDGNNQEVALMLQKEQAFRLIDNLGSEKRVQLLKGSVDFKFAGYLGYSMGLGLSAVSKNKKELSVVVDLKTTGEVSYKNLGILKWDAVDNRYQLYKMEDNVASIRSIVYDDYGNIIVLLSDTDNKLSLRRINAGTNETAWERGLMTVDSSNAKFNMIDLNINIKDDIGNQSEECENCVMVMLTDIYTEGTLFLIDAATGGEIIDKKVENFLGSKFLDVRRTNKGTIFILYEKDNAWGYSGFRNDELDGKTIPLEYKVGEDVKCGRYIDSSNREKCKFIVTQDHYLHVYQFGKPDDEYELIRNNAEFNRSGKELGFDQNSFYDDNMLFIIDNKNQLSFIDMKENMLMYTVPLHGSENDSFSFKFLGLSGDKKTLYLISYVTDEKKIYKVNIESGVIDPIEIALDYSYERNVCVYNDKIYLFDQFDPDDYERSITRIYNTITGEEINEIVPDVERNSFDDWRSIDDKNGYMLYLNEAKNEVRLCDLDTMQSSTVLYIDKGFIDSWSCAYDENSSSFLFCIDSSSIYIVDELTKDVAKINTAIFKKKNLARYKDYVLAFTEANEAYCYDLKSGEFCYRLTDLMRIDDSSSSHIRCYDIDEEKWIIEKKDGRGDYGYTIVDSAWMMVRDTLDANAYYSDKEKFFMNIPVDDESGERNREIVTYRVYTLDDLAEKARKVINNMEMSDAELWKYGLDLEE